jgi:ABC-type glycerol-3-phosphate transport system substrate-binding protein
MALHGVSRRTLLLRSPALVTGSILAAACVRRQAPEGRPAPTLQRGELVYWDWWGTAQSDLAAWFEWVEQEYRSRFPGGTFKMVTVDFSEYPTKFTVAAASGDVPDALHYSNAWVRDFWALGALRALDDLVKKQPDVAMDKFIPASSFYAVRQGKIAGIPMEGPDSEVTLYNTDHFREVGLDPSYDRVKNWTWEDFDQAAMRLTVRRGAEVERPGYTVKVPDGRYFACWMYSQGGLFYKRDYTGLDVNNEKGVNVFAHLLDLLEGKRVSTPITVTNHFDLFLEGRAAMVQGGSWNVGTIQARNPSLAFDMMAYPRHPGGGKYATATWVNMVGIPTNARRVEQAWEFCAWYSSLPVAIKRLAVTNKTSPRLDFYQTPEWQTEVRRVPQLQRIIDVALVGGERPGVRFDQMEAAMRPIFRAVMEGKMSPKEGVAQLEAVTAPILSALPPEAR